MTLEAWQSFILYKQATAIEARLNAQLSPRFGEALFSSVLAVYQPPPPPTKTKEKLGENEHLTFPSHSQMSEITVKDWSLSILPPKPVELIRSCSLCLKMLYS